MKFAFVSDFDNTITRKDFYWIVIEKYLGDEGFNLYCKWQNKQMTVFDYLSCVFSNINQPEEVILKEMENIPVDENAIHFIHTVKEKGGDFFVVSAGCGYYIDVVFEKYGIKDLVTIYANPGRLEKGSLIMEPNQEYFSPEYGIDKAKIVEDVKTRYDYTFFAGDSQPDFNAARSADYCFARIGHQLTGLLDQGKIPYFPFEDFSQIEQETLKLLAQSMK